MYLPAHFSEADRLRVRKLIQENAFMTLLSFPGDGDVFINHLPLIWSPDSEDVLIGHMAKRNPQWAHFKNNPKAIAVVNGAHTYITPRWYKTGRDVPTWNYAVAHVHGRIELLEAFQPQVKVLESLSEFFEKGTPSPWEFELPDDLLDPASLTSAIVSFKLHIEKIGAKFKLSQNRHDMDRQGVIEGLLERTDDDSRRVRELMLENEK